MLAALASAALLAAGPAAWQQPAAAPLRVARFAGIALDGDVVVVAGGRSLRVVPLGRGRAYRRRACAFGFVRGPQSSVAASGGRAAWLCRGKKGLSRVQLRTAALAPPSATARTIDVAAAVEPGSTGSTWLGQLVGGGGVLVYTHGNPLAHPFTIGDVPVPMSAADGLVPVAVSASRVAFVGAPLLRVRTAGVDGSLTVGGNVVSAAFDGDYLDVVVPGRLEVHDLHSGASLILPLSATGHAVAAFGGLAFVAQGHDVLAVDEAHGATWVVASSSQPIVQIVAGRLGIAFVAQRPGVNNPGFVSAMPLRAVRAARWRLPSV